jgi:hypothetical protein
VVSCLYWVFFKYYRSFVGHVVFKSIECCQIPFQYCCCGGQASFLTATWDFPAPGSLRCPLHRVLVCVRTSNGASNLLCAQNLSGLSLHHISLTPDLKVLTCFMGTHTGPAQIIQESHSIVKSLSFVMPSEFLLPCHIPFSVSGSRASVCRMLSACHISKILFIVLHCINHSLQ